MEMNPMAITYDEIVNQCEEFNNVIVAEYRHYHLDLQIASHKELALDLTDYEGLEKFIRSLNPLWEDEELLTSHLLNMKFSHSLFARNYKELIKKLDELNLSLQSLKDFKQKETKELQKDEKVERELIEATMVKLRPALEIFQQVEPKALMLTRDLKNIISLLKEHLINEFIHYKERYKKLKLELDNFNPGEKESIAFGYHNRGLFTDFWPDRTLLPKEMDVLKAKFRDYNKKYAEINHALNNSCTEVEQNKSISPKYMDELKNQFMAFRAQVDGIKKLAKNLGESMVAVLMDVSQRESRFTNNPKGLGDAEALDEKWLEKLIQDFKFDFKKKVYYTQVKPEDLLLQFIFTVHHNPKGYAKSTVQNIESILDNFGGVKSISDAFLTTTEVRGLLGVIRTRKFLPLTTSFAKEQLLGLQKFIADEIKTKVQSRVLYDLGRFVRLNRLHLIQKLDNDQHVSLNDDVIDEVFSSFKLQNRIPVGTKAYQDSLINFLFERKLEIKQKSVVKKILKDLSLLIEKNKATRTPQFLILTLYDFIENNQNATNAKELLNELDNLRSELEWGCADLRELALPPIQEETSLEVAAEGNRIELFEDDSVAAKNLNKKK